MIYDRDDSELFDKLKTRLEGVKPRGELSFQACCPIHEDKNASLSVTLGLDGKLLTNYFAGCNQSVLFLKLRELGNADELAPVSPPPRASATKGATNAQTLDAPPKIVAEYLYETENHEPYSKVLRYDPKAGFPQQSFVDGKWIAKAPAVPILYRLPQVLEAIRDSKTVFIVEGEKDVETLERLGFTATCNAGGANAWKPQHAESLAGADVVIIADNDGSGRKWADTVEQSLVGVAKSVRGLILNLPGKGQDVSDWVKIVSVNTSDDADDSTAADLMHQVDKFSHEWEPGYFTSRPLTGDGIPYPPKADKVESPSGGLSKPQPFPVEAFPPGLREYCLEVARYANADPSVPAISLLGITAALIGATHRIGYGSTYQPSILWGVVVVPSSECKSEALKPLIKLLSRADDRWDVKNKAAMAEYVQECALYKKQACRLGKGQG